MKPDPVAGGPDTVIKRHSQMGDIKGHETFICQTNPRDPKPWQSVKRYDATGKTHYNKKTGESVDAPHVHDPETVGGVRKPKSVEIPKS